MERELNLQWRTEVTPPKATIIFTGCQKLIVSEHLENRRFSQHKSEEELFMFCAILSFSKHNNKLYL